MALLAHFPLRTPALRLSVAMNVSASGNDRDRLRAARYEVVDLGDLCRVVAIVFPGDDDEVDVLFCRFAFRGARDGDEVRIAQRFEHEADGDRCLGARRDGRETERAPDRHA